MAEILDVEDVAAVRWLDKLGPAHRIPHGLLRQGQTHEAIHLRQAGHSAAKRLAALIKLVLRRPQEVPQKLLAYFLWDESVRGLKYAG